MKKLNHKKHPLSAAVSEYKLIRAAVKISNYYRTQNLAGTPDGALLELSRPHSLKALREVVLDGNYEFQPLRPYFTRKNNGGIRMETASSPFDRVLVQALFNSPGYAIQKSLSALSASSGIAVIPACRFMPPSSRYIYSYWPAEYARFRRFTVRMARGMKGGTVLFADIQNFFPSINLDRVRRLLEPWFDESVWPLVNRCLNYKVESPEGTRPFLAGLPIEEPVSRLLGNMYLEKLDRFIIEKLGIPYARYVDDLVFFLPNKAAATDTLTRIEEFLPASLGLFLNAGKVETFTTHEVANNEAAAFSHHLSIINQNMKRIPFFPGKRRELVACLNRMMKEMPSLNAPDSTENALKVRGAKFSAWTRQAKGRKL